MVKTSRESFKKVQEVETDLDAISLIGETGMTPVEVKDAIVKMGGVTSTATEINNVVDNLKTLTSSASEIDSSINRTSQILAIIGDSWIDGETTDSTLKHIKAESYIFRANFEAGCPFDILYDFGIGGETSTQILARVNSVLNTNATHCFWDMGLNDGVDAIALATIKTNIIAMYEALNSKGVYSILSNMPTRLDSSLKNMQGIELNRWIFNYFKNKPNISIFDIAKINVIPTDFNAYPIENRYRDGVHLNNNGAVWISSHLTILFTSLGLKNKNIFLPYSVADNYTTSSLNRQHVLNPLSIGTTGVKGAGVTGSTTTNTTTYLQTASTVIGSKETRVDGFGDYQVFDATFTTAGFFQYIVLTNYQPIAGKKYNMLAEIEVESQNCLKDVKLSVYHGSTPSSYLMGSIFVSTNGGTSSTITKGSVKYLYSLENLTDNGNITGPLSIRIEPTSTKDGTIKVKIGRVALYEVD